MFFLLYLLNSIIWVLVIIIVFLELLKVEYPHKDKISRFLSQIQLPIEETYKVFILFLIPILIGAFLDALRYVLLIIFKM